MTQAQIIAKAKREIKKIVSPNEVINFNFKELDNDEYFFVSVEMPSTCEVNETMVWLFSIDYTPSNEDIFTELEKAEFPNLITKENLTITQVNEAK